MSLNININISAFISPDRATSLHSQAIGQNPSESLTKYRINNNAQFELRTAIVTFTSFSLSEIILENINISSDAAFILAQNLCRKGVKNDPIREPLVVFYISPSQSRKQILLFTQAENIFFVEAVGKEKAKWMYNTFQIYSNSVNKI